MKRGMAFIVKNCPAFITILIYNSSVIISVMKQNAKTFFPSPPPFFLFYCWLGERGGGGGVFFLGGGGGGGGRIGCMQTYTFNFFLFFSFLIFPPSRWDS